MADEFYSIHPDAMSNPGPCHPLAINHEASRYLEFFSERYRQSQLEWERPDEDVGSPIVVTLAWGLTDTCHLCLLTYQLGRPLDHFPNNAVALIQAAQSLESRAPRFRDPELQDQVLFGLDVIIRDIDEALEVVDLNLTSLNFLLHFLCIQAVALRSRAMLLNDISGIRRCISVLEMLPHFNPYGSPLPHWLHGYIAQSIRYKLRLEVECWTSSSIRILEDAAALITGNTLDERFNHNSEAHARVVADLESHITSGDSILKEYRPHSGNMTTLWAMLSLQGHALLLKGLLSQVNDPTEIDRSIFVLEISTQVCDQDSLEYLISSRRLVEALWARYQRDNSIDICDKIVQVSSSLATRPQSLHWDDSDILQVKLYFAQALAIIAILRDQVDYAERALHLCEEGLHVIRTTGPPSVRYIWQTLFLRLLLAASSKFGKRLPDLNHIIEILSDEDFSNLSNPQVKHDLANFLWLQLKLATVAGDTVGAVDILELIHTHDCAIGVFAFVESPCDDLDNAIDTLKTYFAATQDGRVDPFALMLVVLFLSKYSLYKDLTSLREALYYRSFLGPGGSYGWNLDIHLLGPLQSETHVFGHVDISRNCAIPAIRCYDHAEVVGTGQKLSITDIPSTSSSAVHQTRAGRKEKSFLTQNQGGSEGHSKFHLFRCDRRDMKLSLEKYHKTSDEREFCAARDGFDRLSTHFLDEPIELVDIYIDLADLHSSRYQFLTLSADRDQAVHYISRSHDCLADDDQTHKGGLGWRMEWALRVGKMYLRSGCPSRSQVCRALQYLREGATITEHPPHIRLDHVNMWLALVDRAFELSSSIEEAPFKPNGEHIFDMCETGLTIIDEGSWMASNIHYSNYNRQDAENRSFETGLQISAINATISLFDDFGIEQPVAQSDDQTRWFKCGEMGEWFVRLAEFLDASRSLFWRQLAQLRLPLDSELRSVDPSLFFRLRDVSEALSLRWGLRDGDCGGTSLLGLQTWRIWHERNEILKDVRRLPGFEGFLGEISREELMAVGSQGPVVVLLQIWNPTKLDLPGLALIFTPRSMRLVWIPLTVRELRQLHVSLRSMVHTRGDRFTPDESEPSPSSSESDFEDRAARRKRQGGANCVEDVLEKLWEKMVEPLLDAILNETGNGKSKSWAKPEKDKRNRIWWCGIGESSFMPVHAAGIYRGSSPICVSDFFISSYTPSLQALINARKRPISIEAKVLAAAQPSPGWPYERIPNVKIDLREIVDNVPRENLLFPGGENQPDFEGLHTSVANVISKLPEASVLHLACHGTQIPDVPLGSGFILANGEILTILDLLKCHTPNAHTAILSACHTASNDVEQPEQSINLSTALLFCGFRSILASKWPMADCDGPAIAKAVYQAMFKSESPQKQGDPCSTRGEEEDDDMQLPNSSAVNDPAPGVLSEFDLPLVLDDLTRNMRMRGVPAARWATFVHLGA